MYNDQQVGTKIKRLMVLLVVIVAAVIALGILQYSSGESKLIITTSSPADIYVSTDRFSGYTKIGNSSAEFTSRKAPSEVFIKAVNGNDVTISGAILEKGKTTNRDLVIRNSTPPGIISYGSLISPFIEGSLVQGVLADEYTMASFRTDRIEPTRLEFISLPTIEKVVWYDADNFVYRSFGGGIGGFVNGVDLGSSAIGSAIYGTSSEVSESEITSSDSTDISQAPSKPLVVLSSSNIFVSTDRGFSLRSIASFPTEQDTESRLYTSANYIFRVTRELPAYGAGEQDEEEDETHHSSTVTQYNYDGGEISTFQINTERVVGVTSHKDSLYVLTAEGLVRKTGDNIVSIPSPFRFYGGITTFKDRVVVLAGDGLWVVGGDGNSMQRVHKLDPQTTGLQNSLTLTPRNDLLFSSTSTPEANEDNNKLYLTDLKAE